MQGIIRKIISSLYFNLIINRVVYTLTQWLWSCYIMLVSWIVFKGTILKNGEESRIIILKMDEIYTVFILIN